MRAALGEEWASFSRERAMLGAGMMVVTREPQRPASEAPSAGPFDITITGRRISLRHRPTGHIYEYFWFRTAPYLCCGRVREKQGAEVSAWRMCAHAREAAILELRQARLVESLQTVPVPGR